MNTPESKGKGWLTSLLIMGGFLAIVGAIVGPIYWRAAYVSRRAEALAARALPLLDSLIEAERLYKERNGKFWRDARETLSVEATKDALGVDLSRAPDWRFAIYPPDLVADPTLRVAARGTGEAEGIVVECVYDSIAKTKHCKGPGSPP